MDAIMVKATMTKAEDPCFPMEKENVVSLAAQFFAPDYAPQMSLGEWRQEQSADASINKIMTLIETNSLFDFQGRSRSRS